MTPRPDTTLDVDVLVLDVNETLSDLAPLGQTFADLGLPPHMAPLWFASVLRDGFALTLAGRSPRFAAVGEDALGALMAAGGVFAADDAFGRVLETFLGLDVHPDVADGLRRLADGGVRLVTLSNGSTEVAERLLTRAGIRDQVELVLSVEDAGPWKPSREAYQAGLTRCGVEPQRAAMVAVHPWDVDGARVAGMRGVWVSRDGAPWPSSFPLPDETVTGFGDLADRMGC